MTIAQRACATDTARPVTMWENEAVKGMALSCDKIHENDMDEIAALRARQGKYEASLPVDPCDVINAVQDLMQPKSETYPDRFEESLHLSHALRPMIEMLDLSHPGPDRDALLWITDRIMFGLEDVQRNLDRIGDILGNPARVKRQAA